MRKFPFIFIFTTVLLILAIVFFRITDGIQTKQILGEPRRQMIPEGGIGIAVDVKGVDYNRPPVTQIPQYDNSSSISVDLRGAEITTDIQDSSLRDLMFATFDTNTKWPNILPKNFDPHEILELGKDPGLNIKALHEYGIDGSGVSIGIIDAPLLTDHIEYSERLKHYEEVYLLGPEGAYMHGTAVASIALGKSTGVAPNANLYFVAADNMKSYKTASLPFGLTYKYNAEAVNRLLDINAQLPIEDRIRVISMSWNTAPGNMEILLSDGARAMRKALQRAKDENVFLVSSTLSSDYGFFFAGAGRELFADPNDFSSYNIGNFEKGSENSYIGHIFFPMDARTYACQTDADAYTFSAIGGLSWVCPYIAGLYALCAQVYPEITPDIFWKNVTDTASVQITEVADEDFEMRIVNPPALVSVFQRIE
jgi:subtilisin family serine protease